MSDVRPLAAYAGYAAEQFPGLHGPDAHLTDLTLGVIAVAPPQPLKDSINYALSAAMQRDPRDVGREAYLAERRQSGTDDGLPIEVRQRAAGISLLEQAIAREPDALGIPRQQASPSTTDRPSDDALHDILNGNYTPLFEPPSAADRAHARTLNAYAARETQARYNRLWRGQAWRRVAGAALLATLAGAKIFMLSNLEVTYDQDTPVRVPVQVPYTVPKHANVTAATLNAVAHGNRVPAGTGAVDKMAITGIFADAARNHYELVAYAVNGTASEAPVGPDGSFYAAVGTLTPAEQKDKATEDDIAIQRGRIASQAVLQAASDHRVPVSPHVRASVTGEMQPPADTDIAAANTAAGRTSVSELVTQFYQNPKLVPSSVRSILARVLSGKQGFNATFTFQGEKTGYRLEHRQERRSVTVLDTLNLMKDTCTAAMGLLGVGAGLLWATIGGPRRVKNIAARRAERRFGKKSVGAER